jgi:hypothetical protein
MNSLKRNMKMKATLKDVVLGTPAGIKAMEVALKKSCEDQVKLLEEVKNERN